MWRPSTKSEVKKKRMEVKRRKTMAGREMAPMWESPAAGDGPDDGPGEDVSDDGLPGVVVDGAETGALLVPPAFVHPLVEVGVDLDGGEGVDGIKDALETGDVVESFSGPGEATVAPEDAAEFGDLLLGREMSMGADVFLVAIAVTRIPPAAVALVARHGQEPPHPVRLLSYEGFVEFVDEEGDLVVAALRLGPRGEFVLHVVPGLAGLVAEEAGGGLLEYVEVLAIDVEGPDGSGLVEEEA